MNSIMVTDKVREEVYSILREILGRDATGIYIPMVAPHGEAYSTVTKEGYGREIEETDDVTIQYGASRFVIIPYDLPYVIKLPITAVYDTRSFGGEKQFYCYKRHSGYDLMEHENELYYQAEAEYPECADMLLENAWIGKYNGISVWIQDKVEGTQNQLGDYSRFRTASQEEKQEVYNSHDILWGDDIDNDFILIILRKYGAKITQKAMKMINELGLSDLHGGNIGYLSDGSPVLFDYGGYSECDLWI